MSTRGPSQVRVTGPLAPYADRFRALLDGQGFSPWSQMFYLHLIADVSRWLDTQGLDASGLTEANAAAFRQDRRSRGLARFRGTQGLALLLSFLREAGAAPPPAAAGPGDETGVLVAEFAGYLAGERGLRPQTIALYSGSVRRFLDSLPSCGEGVLAGLTADAVRSFVIAESRRRGTGSLKNDVTAVRSLLRFLHLRGLIPDPLDGAAPAAAGWHRPPLTRKIRPEDVNAILASCDRDTHAGHRDYAILMLLARLGLRAGEAAAAGPATSTGDPGRSSSAARADAMNRCRSRPMSAQRSRTTAGTPGRGPWPAECCSCTPAPLTGRCHPRRSAISWPRPAGGPGYRRPAPISSATSPRPRCGGPGHPCPRSASCCATGMRGRHRSTARSTRTSSVP